MRIPLYVVGVLDPFHILVALVRALIEVSLLATFNVTLPWKRVYIKNTSYDAFLSSVALTLKWQRLCLEESCNITLRDCKITVTQY